MKQSVRHSPIGCCFDPAIMNCRSSLVEQYTLSITSKAMQEKFIRRFKAPAAPEHMAGGEEREEWEGDWDDEKAASGSSRRRHGGVQLWILFGIQDAKGESGGGGNLITPRNGTVCTRKFPFPARETKYKME